MQIAGEDTCKKEEKVSLEPDTGLSFAVTVPSNDLELILIIRSGRNGGLLSRSLDPPGCIVSESWGAKAILPDLPLDDIWKRRSGGVVDYYIDCMAEL